MALLVLYLCDRKACDKCNPECSHTNDINHAKSFEKGADEIGYWEKKEDVSEVLSSINSKLGAFNDHINNYFRINGYRRKEGGK